MLCDIAPIIRMPIAARPVVPITLSELGQIQGTSNIPNTPQPCTLIQAFSLKHEQVCILAMQLHKTYALGSFYICLL